MYWKGDHMRQGGVGEMIKSNLVDGIVKKKRESPPVVALETIVNEDFVYYFCVLSTEWYE